MGESIDSTFDAKDILDESSSTNQFVTSSLDGWSWSWIVESLLLCILILFPFIFGMLQSTVELGFNWFNGEKKYELKSFATAFVCGEKQKIDCLVVME